MRPSLLLILIILTAIGPHVSTCRAQDYVLLGWSTTGMHAVKSDVSRFALAPPGNTIQAQLLYRGGGWPQVKTAGFSIEYSIPGNTASAGKTNFWSYAQQLFDLPQPLPANTGLSGSGMSGLMDTVGRIFEARGIPATPFADTNLVTEIPYQRVHLIAREAASGAVVAETDFVLPVSAEVGCLKAGCHGSDQSILNKHEDVQGFNRFGPVLCALCHASEAVGTTGSASAGTLSYRIHRKHRTLAGPALAMETCYRCHPGPTAQFFRGVMRVGIAQPMICQDCHGTMDTVSASITAGRKPWRDEPRCGTCHGPTFSEPEGMLFSQSLGHGRTPCTACHGSAHALTPSRESNDNLQSIRLQGFAGPLRDCRVCHLYPPPFGGPHGLALTAAAASDPTTPDAVALIQNYPNPFNPSTTIQFVIPEPGLATITIHTIDGTCVRTLIRGAVAEGSQAVQWDGRSDDGTSVASGLYLCRLATGGHGASRVIRHASTRLLLLR